MNRRSFSRRRRDAGFTLVEAVMVITITGILSSVVAVFIKTAVDAYFDTARRADMTDAASTVLQRITRDVRAALPNSLRSTSPASTACVEFLPITASGRYRAALSTTGTGDILDFSTTDSSFDVLLSASIPSSFATAATQHVVVYNLGIAGADAYAGDTRAQIDPTATNNKIVLTAARKFPFESPSKRFDVISDYAIVYSCSGGNLLYTTRAISSSQLAACPATGTVLVGNVSSCVFNYTPAVSQRNGLLAVTLVLTQSGESVQLYQEVHVNNVP